MITEIKIGNTSVWLDIQQLLDYNADDTENIIEIKQYICNYKFDKFKIPHGVVIRDDNEGPILFDSVDEAVIYATDYIQKRFHLQA
jgi:hypothetical protein